MVLRDVMLVGGAVYKRGSSLSWQVSFLTWTGLFLALVLYNQSFFMQWKSWYDFFNLDGTRPEKVEPLFISKVSHVMYVEFRSHCQPRYLRT